MGNKQRIYLKSITFGPYASLGYVCVHGYSLSESPVPGLDIDEVFEIVQEKFKQDVHLTIDTREILKTVFNFGVSQTNERPLWIIPNSICCRKYAPLKQAKDLITYEDWLPEKTLHRQFSNLNNKGSQEIVEFANKYGPLNRHQTQHFELRNRETGKVHYLGESLLWWKDEISYLNRLVELWDMLLGKDNRLERLVIWHADGITIRLGDRADDIISRQLGNTHLLNRWGKDDAIGPSAFYLSCEISKRLENTLSPKVQPFANRENYFYPKTLLATIWLMFLWEFSGRSKILRCFSCGGLVDAYHSDKKLCSSACKQREYRKRQKQKKEAQNERSHNKEIQE